MQFALELAFGVLLALAFVPKAPVGTLFYRVMGTAALLCVGLAISVPVASGARGIDDPAVVVALLAALTYPVYSGPVRGGRWAVALGLALAGTGVAVGIVLSGTDVTTSVPLLLLATASALATGSVAGSVGLAMVLGHWYLTVPRLPIHYLQRLNRVTIATMLVSGALVGLSCFLFRSHLTVSREPVLGPIGLFYVGTRVAVGLLVPLLFAAMVQGSLRHRNTRSATGILYASTVLVLIGTAVAVTLQDAYGIPL